MALRRSKRIAEAFKVGSAIEVRLHNEGGWYEATVQAILPKGRGIRVLYANTLNVNLPHLLQEAISLSNVPPRGEVPGETDFYQIVGVQSLRAVHGRPTDSATKGPIRRSPGCPIQDLRAHIQWFWSHFCWTSAPASAMR